MCIVFKKIFKSPYHPEALHARSSDTTERKVWAHWPSTSGQLFLAFVNQFGSCSLRKFDPHDGRFLGIQREDDGDFQVAFRQYFDEGKRLCLSRQPNLEVNCRPKLPDWVLAELQQQIKKEAGRTQ